MVKLCFTVHQITVLEMEVELTEQEANECEVYHSNAYHVAKRLLRPGARKPTVISSETEELYDAEVIDAGMVIE